MNMKLINISLITMFQSLVTWLVDIGMAVGPILGYVSQYRLINETKSVGSFSIDICGILLFANILRLNFYIFKQYEITLVFQSILMIIMQMILLYECSKYSVDEKSQSSKSQQIEPALSDFSKQCKERVEQFWRWKGFQKYGVTVLFFAFCTFVISFIFKLTPLSQYYGELIGLIALTSESVLILPQVLKNIQKKSTKGLSHMLVSFNLFGDIFKLIYFLINEQPFQFILCGIIQVVLDSFVILQIFYYTRLQKLKAKNEGNSPNKIEKIEEVLQSENNLNFPPKDLNSEREKSLKLSKSQLVKRALEVEKQNDNEMEKGENNNQQYSELNEDISDEEQNKDQKIGRTESKRVSQILQIDNVAF